MCLSQNWCALKIHISYQTGGSLANRDPLDPIQFFANKICIYLALPTAKPISSDQRYYVASVFHWIHHETPEFSRYLEKCCQMLPYNCVFCAATFCVYILYRVLLRVQHFDSANNCDNSPGPVGRETGKLSWKVTAQLSEKHNSSKNSTSDYDRIIKRKASRYQLRFVNCPFHCLLQSI